MTTDLALLLIIIFLCTNFLIDSLTTILSMNSISLQLPVELEDVYNKKRFEESKRYILTKSYFSLISSSLSIMLTLGFIYFDGFSKVHEIVSTNFSDPKLVSIAFFGFLFIASDILSIPLEIYAQFGIEEKFGFNKMTYKLYIVDKIKGYLIAAVLGGIVFYLLFWLIETLGENFWVYFWVAISLLMILLNMFYTSLLLPFFNKLSPLEEGSLKDKILEYCQKVHFPLTNVYVIDASKRSTKANAFFSGIGKQKKIVLYDTLINDLNEDEIVAVLAHEVGHFKKKHIFKSMIWSILQTGIILFLASKVLFYQQLSFVFGVYEMALHINFVVFFMLFSPISTIIGLVGNIISRKNEFEADHFAKDTFDYEFLISALKQLSNNSLSNLTPHSFDVFINYSHPTLLHRIRFLVQK